MSKNIYFGVLLVTIFFSGVYSTHAADFNLVPSTANLSLKQEFSADLKINTSGNSINAAQVKVKFPQDAIEVKNVSKDGSAFNFWLQEPIFSNATGEVKFIAGTPNGVIGAAIQVLRINFITKTAGSAAISLVEGAISSSDGSGTDILSASNGATFTISNTISAPKQEILILPPVQITRKPIEATGLPIQPKLSVSLYPDRSKWYNLVGPFTASWELPLDISSVSTALNGNPNFEAPAKSEGLFNSKTFPSLGKDGVYYLHVRFQNNIGWGKTSHYRLAVDTQPPLPFSINVKSGLSSDNPSPILTFNTGDSLSGVGQYAITIGSEEPKFVAISEYAIPPHLPGKYTIKITALDMAGNGVEGRVDVEILSIDSPVINSITEDIIRGENNLLRAEGTALPDVAVIMTITNKDKSLVAQGEAQSDYTGAWVFQLDRELKTGEYLVTARARDSRGAISLPTDSRKVRVKDKPIVSLFGFDLTFKGLAWTLTTILIVAGLYYWRRTTIHNAKMQLVTSVVSSDLRNTIGRIRAQLDNIDAVSKKVTSAESKNVEYTFSNQKIRENLNKIEKYLTKDIERLV